MEKFPLKSDFRPSICPKKVFNGHKAEVSIRGVGVRD
jgi:hypothetical protein